MISLDDLTTPLTREQVEAKIYEVLALIGVSTTSWKPGGVVRTMIVACAIIMAAFSTLTAKIARSGWLETSEGAWLALVARYVYAVEKRYATFAEGTVTLVNGGGGIFDVDADDLTFVNARTGKTYRNAAAFSLAAMGSVVVVVRAVEAGSSSTAAPGEILEMQNPLAGVSCSNPAAVVGLDDEEDPALRVRCAEKLGSLSPFGPWDAYSFAARNAVRSDGGTVGVTRVRTVKLGGGRIIVYAATASGTITGTIGNTATDLGAVDDAIQRRAAPLCVTADTVSASVAIVPLTLRVWLYNTSGLSPDEIKAAINTRLIAFMAGQPLGGNIIDFSPGRVFLDAIRTAIGQALPQIFHVEIVAPTTDVVLAINQVPVLGAVTYAAINQVAPSEGTL